MVTNQMDEIYRLTSEIMNVPKSKVKELIEFQYQHFKEWADNPTTYSYYFSYLGSFTASIRRITYKCKHLIKKLRKDPTNEELKQEFRKWWKYRQHISKIYRTHVKTSKKRKRTI